MVNHNETKQLIMITLTVANVSMDKDQYDKDEYVNTSDS